MRHRLTIVLTVVVILVVLVVLNAVTYVKEQRVNDSEWTANRSTYHSGPTGTRALYDFLSESGHKVMRWREATDKLLGDSGKNVTTLVVVGHTQLPFTDDEAESLLAWVRRGGQLVLIDRQPDSHLLPKSGDWTLVSNELDLPAIDLDPNDPKQMTEDVVALHPVQTTLLTENVENVMPSRFAARIKLSAQTPSPTKRRTGHQSSQAQSDDDIQHGTSPAPVVHVADRDGALLVDYSYGLGRITLLGDPYIVANNGISLNDNLQLAINTITSVNGLVAFDEFHQGRGVTENEFASYFSGTPVLAIAAQIVAIILLVLWTASRRFGRPLPLVQVDRRSSLEFVASMSELQERSRAFDLAVENIYSRTRRVRGPFCPA